MDLSGHYFFDGMDIWTAFNMFVESGSDDFLKYPPMKDGIVHDWMDSNGVDYDTSQNFLGPREITLKCAILSGSSADFWTNYNNFISLMVQPGLRRIQVAEFVGKSYQVRYKSCDSFSRFTRILDADPDHQIACKFTLTVVETNPAPNQTDTFLVTEDGRFIIT